MMFLFVKVNNYYWQVRIITIFKSFIIYILFVIYYSNLDLNKCDYLNALPFLIK